MKPFVKTALLTGLLVGTTDLIAAYASQYIQTGRFASKLLYYIAGGALGLETSLQGGFWMGVLGFFFHYFIATSFTFLFFIICTKITIVRFNPYVIGFLYGVVVGAVMEFIVLPLTQLPHSPFDMGKSFVAWTIVGVALGIPIALSARRFYKRKYAGISG